jgi:hypothetical protein
MAARAGIFWDTPPIALVPRVENYRDRLWQAVGLLGDFFAAQMEAFARINAPWVDRTSLARKGLRAFARKMATSVVIYLVHSMEYGPHLELGTRFMAPRPIIIPTLERHYAPLIRALRRLLGG